MQSNCISIGLLLDSHLIPAWLYHSIESLVRIDGVSIAHIFLSSTMQVPASGLRRKKTPAAFSLFHLLDEKIFLRSADAAELRNIRDLLPGSSFTTVHLTEQDDGYEISPGDIMKIRACRPDILIKAGFGVLRGEILNIPKYGMWAFSIQEGQNNGQVAPGFWEVLLGQPETETSLEILSPDAKRQRRVYHSWIATYPYSPARNQNVTCWTTAAFLPRQIQLLQKFGPEAFWEYIEKYNQEPHHEMMHNPPSTFSIYKLIAKLYAKVFTEVYRRFFYLGKWFLLYSFDSDNSTVFSNYKKIEPPKGCFWADPMVIQRDGKFYIFFEEYPYQRRKGHLSVIELNQQGVHSSPEPILKTEYHLSYPFIFEWEGVYYMVPETACNRTIDLYECVEFPIRWKFKKHLMENVRAVDTTLLYHEGKWWMFTGMAENEAAFPQVELFLFSTDNLLEGDWTPHPLNPIVSDVKRARPAGKIFKKNGKIFRPSQDCSKLYGHGFDLNEITLLSETGYSEQPAMVVRPEWDRSIIATHTYATEGQLTIIDAFTYRRKI